MLGGMQNWPLRIMRLLDHAEREHGTRDIVSRYANGEVLRTNWAGIARDARRLANALERIGVRPGDRVATLAMNHGRHLVAWYGAIGMGSILHTLNPRLFDEQLVYIINHADDRVLLYDASFAPIVERLKSRLPCVRHYICFDPPETEGFEALIAGESDEYRWVEGDERAPAMLCYTSGTTGNPKGVIYHHRSTVLHAVAACLPDVFDISACSSIMPIVPMFHAAAWGLPFAAAGAGAKLVFTTDYAPDVVLDRIRAEGVTHSAGVPTIWLALIAHVAASSGNYGSLRLLSIGGSAAPRTMIDHFDSHGVRIGHVWGMTEMSPIGTVSGPLPAWKTMDRERRIDILTRQGRVPFGVELRIVDDESCDLPRDGETRGRLQARGPWVIEQYFQDETGPTVDPDGWFDTGDVAVIHPDGTMQITDRSKDIIKSGGEWISSIELENAAVGCFGVAEAAAIGVPHPKWDERPLLLIVRTEGSTVTPGDILSHLSLRVAKWWLPDEILFVDQLPHTATGKLLKTALREQYRNYALDLHR